MWWIDPRISHKSLKGLGRDDSTSSIARHGNVLSDFVANVGFTDDLYEGLAHRLYGLHCHNVHSLGDELSHRIPVPAPSSTTGGCTTQKLIDHRRVIGG